MRKRICDPDGKLHRIQQPIASRLARGFLFPRVGGALPRNVDLVPPWTTFPQAGQLAARQASSVPAPQLLSQRRRKAVMGSSERGPAEGTPSWSPGGVRQSPRFSGSCLTPAESVRQRPRSKSQASQSSYRAPVDIRLMCALRLSTSCQRATRRAGPSRSPS